MKSCKWTLMLVIACLLPGMLVCQQTPTGNELTNDQQRTLESIQKVDDWPLYVMHYYADYDLESLVGEVDIQTSHQSNASRKEFFEYACTCFAALNQESDPILGRNFDWYDHPALILFTHPEDAYASVSMVDISYFGQTKESDHIQDPESLLNTPFAPFDGMNEHGLAVGMNALPHGEGGNDPEKTTISSLVMIRLLLDYASTVDEALDLMKDYNVDFQGGPPIHYIIADASGNSVIVEYLDNVMSILIDDRPWQVTTNFILTGKSQEEALDACWRYKTTFERLESRGGSLSEEESMSLLQEVSVENTIWSMVYNMNTKSITVAMGKKYDDIHTFELE